MTEEQLATVFQECGRVVDCRVCGDPNSAMKFAFIEFLEEAAVKMVSVLQQEVSSVPSIRSKKELVLAGANQKWHCVGVISIESAAFQNSHRPCQQPVPSPY